MRRTILGIIVATCILVLINSFSKKMREKPKVLAILPEDEKEASLLSKRIVRPPLRKGKRKIRKGRRSEKRAKTK